MKYYLKARQLMRELEAEEDRHAETKAARDKLQQRVHALENELEQRRREYNDLKDQHAALRRKVREQTSADLLYNALVATGIVPENRNRKLTGTIDDHDRLTSQLGAYQQMSGLGLQQQSHSLAEALLGRGF